MPPQNRERSSKERDPKKRIIFRVLIRTCQRAQQIGTKRQKYVEEKTPFFVRAALSTAKISPFPVSEIYVMCVCVLIFYPVHCVDVDSN